MKFDPDHYPTSCGVYIMKDINDRVLYIGKAKNLKKRLSQYFQNRDNRPAVQYLVKETNKIDILLVFNEIEALLLENNLIKKEKPKYNILLKDDKTFITLMLTDHKWPCLRIVRLKTHPKDKNRYFGPYVSASAAKEVLNLLLDLFKLRQCSDIEVVSRKRACMLYDIGKCLAPCVNLCAEEQYRKNVAGAEQFLKGNNKKILLDLKQQMQTAANEKKFERAHEFLSLIKKIDALFIPQHVELFNIHNLHVLGYAQKGSSITIVKLIFHDGKLINSIDFHFFFVASDLTDLFSSFILQHYLETTPPKEIVMPLDLPNISDIEKILFNAHLKKTSLVYPLKGEKEKLLELANKNALHAFSLYEKKISLVQKQLFELKEKLFLKNFPKKIECFDTSSIAEKERVAAMIAYINGQKEKNLTKTFKIKTRAGGDIAAMKEALERHLAKCPSFADLIILDGGKAHLNMARELLKKLKITTIDIIGLAKEDAKHEKGLTQEKIYLLEREDPLILDLQSPLLFLLQRIRDDAHNAAIIFHKKRRGKGSLAREKITGISDVKMNLLLKHFKSLSNIKAATLASLRKIPGITVRDLNALQKHFKQK